MTLIISTSNSSLRSMTNRMTSLRITDFDGKNVAQAVSYFRGGRTILLKNNFEPPDFDTIIFDSFKASSTPEFNALVTTMQTNKSLGVSMVPVGLAALGHTDSSIGRDQIDDCLQAMETEYMNLVSKNKWLAKSGTHDQESSFNSAGSTRNITNKSNGGSSKLTCFNCGKTGHGYPDCDKPINEETIKANRDKFLANKSSARNCQSNRPSSRPVNTNNSSTTSSQDLSIIPPKEGKPHVRILSSGKVLYWCQTCARWNDSHETRFHTDENALCTNSTPSDDQSQSGATLGTQAEYTNLVTDIGGAVRGSFGPPHFL